MAAYQNHLLEQACMTPPGMPHCVTYTLFLLPPLPKSLHEDRLLYLLIIATLLVTGYPGCKIPILFIFRDQYWYHVTNNFQVISLWCLIPLRSIMVSNPLIYDACKQDGIFSNPTSNSASSRTAKYNSPGSYLQVIFRLRQGQSLSFCHLFCFTIDMIAVSFAMAMIAVSFAMA